jgi:hypothetical protein
LLSASIELHTYNVLSCYMLKLLISESILLGPSKSVRYSALAFDENLIIPITMAFNFEQLPVTVSRNIL